MNKFNIVLNNPFSKSRLKILQGRIKEFYNYIIIQKLFFFLVNAANKQFNIKQDKNFTVARSFCDNPLFCRPCWISLPSSSGIWSCFNSSVSRSNLAVFFVVTCCLFAPPPPIIRIFFYFRKLHLIKLSERNYRIAHICGKTQ